MIKVAAKSIVDFFASYLLAAVILTLLLLLTFFGTLEQVHQGLFQVQQKYFESILLVHWIGGVVPIPLVGGFVLMPLLFLNLLCGAILRAPKQWRHPGMLIAHGGIMLLVLAAFVTNKFSTNGRMLLYEGQTANDYQDYYLWELTVTELGGVTGKQFVINDKALQATPKDKAAIFTAQGMPFDVVIEGFAPNCRPRPAQPGIAEGIDGVVLQAMPLEKEAEMNVAGCYATLVENGGKAGGAHAAMKDGGGGLDTHVGVLWGLQNAPWIARVGDRDYAIDLRHKRYPVPFSIRLDKFIHELHPRTQMASNFESVVTKTENGVDRQIQIKMNEPLRHLGYTLFQASWGPENAQPGEPLFSVFAVVQNPADHWPLYSCIVVACGLLIHFLQKLARYLRAENRRRVAT